jgi:hypothetical protein
MPEAMMIPAPTAGPGVDRLLDQEIAEKRGEQDLDILHGCHDHRLPGR